MNTESTTEAEAFYHFLGEQLGHGGDQPTLDEFLKRWREQREYDQTVAAVREGSRDAEGGRMRPLREMLAELPESLQNQSTNAS